MISADADAALMLPHVDERKSRQLRASWPALFDDLTDEEWALIDPLIPRAKRGGNKRTVDVRVVVDGVMDVLSTGCQWAALPKDLPPLSTVNDDFRRWDWDGTLVRIHHALYVQCHEQVGREASPTAAIIDSQSVKGAAIGGARSIRPATTVARRSKAKSGSSSSTGKAWRCRPPVHAADLQDRDGGVLLMGTLFGQYLFLLKPYADAGNQGPKFQDGLKAVCHTVNIKNI